MNLLKEVISEIKPKKKVIIPGIKEFLKKLNDQLNKDGIKAKAIIGGSIAKDTFLKGDYDCDIYVQFDRSYENQDISRILGIELKKAFGKITKLHGSRDYYQIPCDSENINFEIVPTLKIKNYEDAKNITDCSYLHVRWVKKFPSINDEIRLSKAFCKAIGVYGAESYIKGFSGHVVDILTINSKGFLNLLKDSVKWKHKQIIDTNNFHKGKALFNLNKSKTKSALITIDPIDPYRNASAALEKEKFELFKKKAKEFLKKPSKDFFIKQEISIDDIKKNSKDKILILNIESLKGKNDVIGAKLLKAYEFLIKQFSKNDFIIIKSGWTWDKNNKALFYFVFPRKKLDETVIKTGPPKEKKEFVKIFKEKYKNTFMKNGKLCSKVKREFITPENFMKKIIKDNYFTEKIKKANFKVLR